MLISVKGIYRNGQIELTELPAHVTEETQVIVTFIESEGIDLSSHGIDQTHAESLRTNLTTFAEDWNSSEMSIYDNYDAAKSHS